MKLSELYDCFVKHDSDDGDNDDDNVQTSILYAQTKSDKLHVHVQCPNEAVNHFTNLVKGSF